MSGRDAWAPLADRGRLSLEVFTAAKAQAAGLPAVAPWELLGVVTPDGGPSTLIEFPSKALAAQFVLEMAPRHVTILAAEGEDRAAIECEILAR